MRSAIVVALTAAAGVSAQSVPTYESSLDMTIDPNSVQPAVLKSDWCRAQFNTCEILCGRDTKDNDCKESDLSYKCTCSRNSSAPGLQYYTQTMPTFICKELFSQCNLQHVGDSRSQQACEDNIDEKCARQDPPKNPVDAEDSDESTTSSAAASQTTSGSGSGSTPGPSDSEETVTTTSSDGLAAPTLAAAGNGVAAIAAIGVLAYLL